MPLDIGPTDFNHADIAVRKRQIEQARRHCEAVADQFARNQRDRYERCEQTNIEIEDAKDALIEIGVRCVQFEDELKDLAQKAGLNLYYPHKSGFLARIAGEAVVEHCLIEGVELVLASIAAETV